MCRAPLYITSSVANPAPRTMTPEYKEATKKYLLEQNANPIRGLSSKANQEISE